jgi:hypothetical protein
MDVSIVVLDPAAPAGNAPQVARQSLVGLKDKVVGFIDNSKANFNNLADDVGELLIAKYGVKAVIKRRKRGPAVPAPDEVMKELIEQCDAVVTGSGD